MVPANTAEVVARVRDDYRRGLIRTNLFDALVLADALTAAEVRIAHLTKAGEASARSAEAFEEHFHRRGEELEAAEARAEKAEARCRELEGALVRIAGDHTTSPVFPHGHIFSADCDACHRQRIARAALSPAQSETGR